MTEKEAENKTPSKGMVFVIALALLAIAGTICWVSQMPGTQFVPIFTTAVVNMSEPYDILNPDVTLKNVGDILNVTLITSIDVTQGAAHAAAIITTKTMIFNYTGQFIYMTYDNDTTIIMPLANITMPVSIGVNLKMYPLPDGYLLIKIYKSDININLNP